MYTQSMFLAKIRKLLVSFLSKKYHLIAFKISNIIHRHVRLMIPIYLTNFRSASARYGTASVWSL